CRVVSAHALADCVSKDRTKQADSARCNTMPTTNDRQTAWLGLLAASSDAGSYIMHEGFNIIPSDRLDRHSAEQRDNMPHDPAAIGDQSGFLLGDLSPGQ